MKIQDILPHDVAASITSYLSFREKKNFSISSKNIGSLFANSILKSESLNIANWSDKNPNLIASLISKLTTTALMMKSEQLFKNVFQARYLYPTFVVKNTPQIISEYFDNKVLAKIIEEHSSIGPALEYLKVFHKFESLYVLGLYQLHPEKFLAKDLKELIDCYGEERLLDDLQQALDTRNLDRVRCFAEASPLLKGIALDYACRNNWMIQTEFLFPDEINPEIKTQAQLSQIFTESQSNLEALTQIQSKITKEKVNELLPVHKQAIIQSLATNKRVDLLLPLISDPSIYDCCSDSIRTKIFQQLLFNAPVDFLKTVLSPDIQISQPQLKEIELSLRKLPINDWLEIRAYLCTTQRNYFSMDMDNLGQFKEGLLYSLINQILTKNFDYSKLQQLLSSYSIPLNEISAMMDIYFENDEYQNIHNPNYDPLSMGHFNCFEFNVVKNSLKIFQFLDDDFKLKYSTMFLEDYSSIDTTSDYRLDFIFKSFIDSAKVCTKIKKLLLSKKTERPIEVFLKALERNSDIAIEVLSKFTPDERLYIFHIAAHEGNELILNLFLQNDSLKIEEKSLFEIARSVKNFNTTARLTLHFSSGL